MEVISPVWWRRGSGNKIPRPGDGVVGDAVSEKALARSATEELIWCSGRRRRGSYSGSLDSKGDGEMSSRWPVTRQWW